MVKAKLLGTDEVERKIASMAMSMPGIADKAALKGAQAVEGFAKGNIRTQGEQIGTKTTKSGKERAVYAALGAPIADKLTSRTGNLRASIRSESAGGGRAVVGPTALYGAIHEFGGTIVPKTAPALVFRLPDGSWRRTQRVTMPARPYLRPGYEDHRDEVRRVMVDDMTKRLAEAMGR